MGLTVLALAIRLASVLVHPDKSIGESDALFYHDAANLMARGIFGINPILYYTRPDHPRVASAQFPPLFSGVLALASVVGAKSVLAHRIWCCFIGAAAIPLAALFGRQISAANAEEGEGGRTLALSGRRVGLIAAFLLAVYPNIWMSDTLLLSETLTPVLVLIVLMSSYRFWRAPSLGNAALVGASVAAGALARDEMALLVPLLVFPLMLLARLPWRRRLASLGVGLVVAAAVVGPWAGWNLVRFKDPVFISDGIGVTLASVSCNQTWNGPFAGYWSLVCAERYAHGVHGDDSQVSAELESRAETYIKHHLRSFPRAVAEKVGRGFAFYRPFQQLHFDSYVETRPPLWTHVGLWMYYSLLALGVGGAVLLRRRGTILLPMLAVGASVVITMATAFGNTRYRTSFEVVLVVLAAVALDALLRRATGRRRRRELAAPAGNGPQP